MIIAPGGYSVYETGQKAVIWYENGVETLIVSTTFSGQAKNFGWILPTPAEPQVSQASDELFTALDDLTRPKYKAEPIPMLGAPPNSLSIPSIKEDTSPTILQTKKVGIFDLTVLKASDAEGLTKWLEKNGYPYPSDHQLTMQSYIDKNWYFSVAKVDSSTLSSGGKYLKSGHASPIQLSFKTDQIVYPLKISGLATQDNNSNTKKVAYSFENSLEGWSNYFSEDYSYYGNNSKVIKSNQVTRSNITSYNGKYSLQLTVNDDTTPEAGASIYLSGLKSQTEYAVSAYVSSPQATKSAYISTSSGGSGFGNSEVVILKPQWQRIEATFSTISDYGYIRLLVKSPETGDLVYWDGVQIEEASKATDFDPKAVGKTFNIQNNDYNYQQTVRPTDVSILLYIFSDHKKELPGFTTSYASWVPADKIKKLAFTPDGSKPWVEPKSKFYLTKLTRYMATSAMTDDLILRNADNNDSVNAESFVETGKIRFFGIVAAVLLVEIGGIVWFLRKRKKNKIIEPENY